MNAAAGERCAAIPHFRPSGDWEEGSQDFTGTFERAVHLARERHGLLEQPREGSRAPGHLGAPLTRRCTTEGDHCHNWGGPPRPTPQANPQPQPCHDTAARSPKARSTLGDVSRWEAFAAEAYGVPLRKGSTAARNSSRPASPLPALVPSLGRSPLRASPAPSPKRPFIAPQMGFWDAAPVGTYQGSTGVFGADKERGHPVPASGMQSPLRPGHQGGENSLGRSTEDAYDSMYDVQSFSVWTKEQEHPSAMPGVEKASDPREKECAIARLGAAFRSLFSWARLGREGRHHDAQRRS